MSRWSTKVCGWFAVSAAGIFAAEASLTIKVAYDNYVADPACRSDWGFACVVTGPEKTILFDAGGKGDLLLANLEAMRVRPTDVRSVVISHNHGDHTGGLLPFLKENRDVSVFLPAGTPEAFASDVGAAAATVTVVNQPAEVCKGVFVLGHTMSPVTVEQSLVLETGQGLVIVTGCAHPGIVAITKRAKEELRRDVFMVLGGFHLLKHSEEEVNGVIRELKALGVRKVGPSHCSGDRAIAMFKEAFGDGFVRLGVGQVVATDAREGGPESGMLPLPPGEKITAPWQTVLTLDEGKVAPEDAAGFRVAEEAKVGRALVVGPWLGLQRPRRLALAAALCPIQPGVAGAGATDHAPIRRAELPRLPQAWRIRPPHRLPRAAEGRRARFPRPVRPAI